MEIKREFKCSCGRIHKSGIEAYAIGAGAMNTVLQYLEEYACQRPLIVADVNTYKAAGDKLCAILQNGGYTCTQYVLQDEHVEPDERVAGLLMMHYPTATDCIIGVGSGVVNDLCKILSRVSGNPYILIATAPSMDGYASVTSSVVMDGLKWSIEGKCADVIIGDTDILKNAPKKMLIAGLGDLLAKYIALADWRIANLVTGEYYCEEIAQLVRVAVKKCMDNSALLLQRDPVAVEAFFSGLLLSGAAMNYAGITRVASGIEHSISHIWDMRSVAFGTNSDFHGIQCGIGTLYAAKIYDKLRHFVPDKEKAIAYAESFDFAAYSKELSAFIGKGASAMIAREANDGKYDTAKHAIRIQRICAHWEEIRTIIQEEVPPSAEIERILDAIDAPKTCADIGIDHALMPMTFAATKDIRDKYVLSRLCWDLGMINEIDFA
ncbi:MAG: sn-glycerol-1-phosphate dehydrogenase [Clostridia bacterium]|nr:sn-glycerol-1-phosphate dehydrogenase [Clostridia bacterium]